MLIKILIPCFDLQYFLPFATDEINKQIELAILRADKMGVKVISLAALNKVRPASDPLISLCSLLQEEHKLYSERHKNKGTTSLGCSHGACCMY